MAKIGRYEILDELGEGSTAAVYLAQDPYMKRAVAVKVLSYGRTDDELFTHFFQQEAETISALEHPAIAEVYDFGVEGIQPYIVTRYLGGGTLMDRIKAKTLSQSAISGMLKRVAGALDEAHSQHIIHRDVKPSNILYDEDDQAYLADFGLAKFIRRTSGITKKLFVGTVHYLSPEHISGQQLDGRTDIYALGVILFLCLTRNLPFPFKDPTSVAKAHLKKPIPSVQTINPDLPGLWDEIIQRAMAKDRNERYQTAAALAADVELATSRRWHLRALA